MFLRFHWFLPTNGDGREIVGGGHGVATGAAGTIRPATLAYLGQVARSAEQLGFEAALTPTGIWCEDAWLVTAMLVSPNLWAGIGLLRAGAGTALVGSHAEVADRIEEYTRLGLSEFILSGYPHLEEAYWFGEGVLPILRARGLWQHPDPKTTDGTVNAVPFAPTSGPALP